MYCIVNQQRGWVAFADTTDIGKYDTNEVTIYYIPNGNVAKYQDGKFYDINGEEYSGQVIDVTNDYVDLSALSTNIVVGNTLELNLPKGEYEVYYERMLASKFTSDGVATRRFVPMRAGRYKIISIDKPCAPMVIYVAEQACEII